MPVHAKLVGLSEKRLVQAWDRNARARCRRDGAILGMWTMATMLVLIRLARQAQCGTSCRAGNAALRRVAERWSAPLIHQPTRRHVRAWAADTTARRRRQRADLRDAPTEELVALLWTLRTVSGESGRAQFGSTYVSYAELVDLHADDAKHFASCSGIHSSSPIFFVYHRLLLQAVEASLRAVSGNASTSLAVWTPTPVDDDFFNGGPVPADVVGLLGSKPGDARRAYAVADGAFAFWPVDRRDGPDRGLPDFLVRYRTYCDRPNATDSFAERWWQTSQSRSLDEFINRSHDLHARWHRSLGGAANCRDDAPGTPGDFDNERTSPNDPAFLVIHAAFDALVDDFAHTFPDFVSEFWLKFRRAIDRCLREPSPAAAYFADHPYRRWFVDRSAFTSLFDLDGDLDASEARHHPN